MKEKKQKQNFYPVNSRGEPTLTARILRQFQGRTFTTQDIAEELGVARTTAWNGIRRVVEYGWAEGEMIVEDCQLDFFDEVRTAKGHGKIMEYTITDASALDDCDGTFLDEETRAYLDTLRPLVGVV